MCEFCFPFHSCCMCITHNFMGRQWKGTMTSADAHIKGTDRTTFILSSPRVFDITYFCLFGLLFFLSLPSPLYHRESSFSIYFVFNLDATVSFFFASADFSFFNLDLSSISFLCLFIYRRFQFYAQRTTPFMLFSLWENTELSCLFSTKIASTLYEFWMGIIHPETVNRLLW